MFDILSYYLENGMRVMLHKEPGIKLITIGVIINQGSMNESNETNGISHFLEHMIVNLSCQNQDTLDLFEELHEHGADYNAITDKAMTSYYISGFASGLKTYLKLLKQIVYHHRSFSDEAITNEKKIVERELVSYYASLNQISDRAIQALYGSKSVGRIIVGSKENLNAFTIDEILSVLSDTYIAENSALVIFGDFDYSQAVQLIDEHFSDIPDNITKQYHETVTSTPSIYYNSNYNGENAVLTLCFRNMIDSCKNDALDIVLSGLCNPTLTKRAAFILRNETGLSYNVGGFYRAIKNYIGYGITSVFKAENAPEVLKVLIESINVLKKDGFSEKETGIIKKNVLKDRLYTNSNIQRQSDQLIRMAVSPYVYSPDNEIRKIERLELDQLNSLLNDLLNSNRMGLACIGRCDIDAMIKVLDNA